MHPSNIYNEKIDFLDLAKRYNFFREKVSIDVDQKVKVDFHDADFVSCLSRALLLRDFNLDLQLDRGQLVPRTPNRLNYLLWLKDLANLNKFEEQISLLDIGTGASCIYPLLASRHFGWRAVGTEQDPNAAKKAKENLVRNNLCDQIMVLLVDKSSFLVDALKQLEGEKRGHFHFSICNPPFFDCFELISKDVDVEATPSTLIKASSRSKRPAPNSITLAKNSEISAEGGEVAFIKHIMDDSKILQSKIRIYTSMVGKKSSLKPLVEYLAVIDAKSFDIVTFTHGRTQRWWIAWTFEDLNLKIETFSIASLFTNVGQISHLLHFTLPSYYKTLSDGEARFTSIIDGLGISYELNETKKRDSVEYQCKNFSFSHLFGTQRKRKKFSRQNGADNTEPISFVATLTRESESDNRFQLILLPAKGTEVEKRTLHRFMQYCHNKF